MNYGFFFLLGLSAFVLAFGSSFIKNEKERFPGYILVLIGVVSGIFFTISKDVYIEVHSNVPTALDVYKGKTTLQITYRDSVPIDTVVVFKTKK